MEQNLCIFNRPLKTYYLLLKDVTMINPGTVRFGVMKHKDKQSTMIKNLVETMWLARYYRPTEITYDQGS